MAIRRLEAHVMGSNRQEAPTKEELEELGCLKDLDLFETMCKILNTVIKVKKIWNRRQFMPWFRAKMTAWLSQTDIGSAAFKRAFVTHRKALITAVIRTL